MYTLRSYRPRNYKNMRAVLFDRTGLEVVADFEVPLEAAPFLQHLAQRRPLKLRQKRDLHFLHECGIATASDWPDLDAERTFHFLEFNEAMATAIYVEV